MSIPVNISFSEPDPDVAPATFGDAVEQLNPLITGSIDETISTFIMGVEVPDVEDQDKPWMRINTLGNPVGWYIFTQAVWVREEPPISARFGWFTGDPADYFDDTGKGLKGSGPIAMDYWGWALMNGNNGTGNWSNRFVISGAMDNEGIIGFGAGGWRTNINGVEETTGGVAEIVLDADNTYFPGVTVGTHEADGSTPDPSGPLYGTPSGNPTVIGTVNDDPAPISVVPPFMCVALIQFIGYLPP